MKRARRGWKSCLGRAVLVIALLLFGSQEVLLFGEVLLQENFSHIEQAEKAYTAGRYQEALELLKTQVSFNPELAPEWDSMLKRCLVRKLFEEKYLSKLSASQQKQRTCFITYGWENRVNEWVRTYLVPDLEKVQGLRLIVDCQSLRSGNSVLEHAGFIATADYVCAIMTPLVKKKWDEYQQKPTVKRPGIVEELMYVRHRLFRTDRHSSRTVIPLLIEGTEATSFPDFLTKETNVYRLRDCLEDDKREQTYYEEMLKLVVDMLEVSRNDREDIVKAFQKDRREIEAKKLGIEEERSVLEWARQKESRRNDIMTRLERGEFNGKVANLPLPLAEFGEMPLRSPHFVGRKKELEQLAKAFTPTKEGATVLVVESGLGGVGKTQLAIEYSYRHLDQYRFISFLHAGSASEVSGAFCRLAEKLHLYIEDIKADESALIRRIREWFEGTTGWLLIFDNVEERKYLQEFIPRIGGHVLITTRRQDLGMAKENIVVAPFEREESLRYVSAITGSQEDPTIVNQLADELGDLPLALAQACAYIKENIHEQSAAITRYLELYRIRRKEIHKAERNPDDNYEYWVSKEDLRCRGLKDHVEELWQELLTRGYIDPYGKVQFKFHACRGIDRFEIDAKFADVKTDLYRALECSPNTVDVTWKISLEKIQEEESKQNSSHLALDVLNMCGYLSSYDIPLELLRESSIAMGKTKPREAKQNINEAVGLLKKYSMVSRSQDNTISLHRVVQQVVRDSISSEHAAEYVQVLISTLNRLITFDQKKMSTWQESKPYIEQGIQVLEYGSVGEQTVRLMSTIALYKSTVEALYGFSRDYYERVLTMERKLDGNRAHVDIAATLNNLGNVLRDQEEYVCAYAYYEQALKMLKELYGDGAHADIASTLNNLGILARQQGDYEKAKTYYEQALSMYRRVYGNVPNADIAYTLNNLGLVACYHGNYFEAKECYERALSMKKQVYGDRAHVDIANTLNNLGELARKQKEYAKARVYYEQALAMKKEVYGERAHISLASTLQNLGFVARQDGDFAKAQAYYEQSLLMYKHVYGLQAHSDRTLGGYETETVSGKVGKNHMADFWNNTIGRIRYREGKYDEAIQAYDKALEVDPSYAEAWYAKGIAYGKKGQTQGAKFYKEALKAYDAAIAGFTRLAKEGVISLKRTPERWRTYALSHNNKGVDLANLGQYAEAVREFEAALELYPNYWETWDGKGHVLFYPQANEEVSTYVPNSNRPNLS